MAKISAWVPVPSNLRSFPTKTKKPGQIRNFVIGRLRNAGISIGPSPSNILLSEICNEAAGWNLKIKPKGIIKRFYTDEPTIIKIPVITKPKTKPKANKRKQKKLKFVQTNDFLKSFEWRQIRYKALKLNDGRCELCGRSKKDGIILNVDHIKPRKVHPELALEIGNLQVLCNECNHGKGNRDTTDWREPKL